MQEVYRGSKAAFHQFMRSYTARQSGKSRAMVLMAAGWVRTELVGPEAPLSLEDSVPNLVNVLLKKQGNPVSSTSTTWAGPFLGDAARTLLARPSHLTISHYIS
jgi:hypothetical protein